MSIYSNEAFSRGFGTFPLKGDDARAAIETALDVGYRAFDTAQMYGNEAETGAALRDSDVARSDLLITTKVHPDNFDTNLFLSSVETSIGNLGDIPDVLLLHWPDTSGDVGPSLGLLQSALDREMTRAIGISNYTISQMEIAASELSAPIACNQVEFHPLLDQSRLLAAANRLGIPLTSYCSIARGMVIDQPVLHEIGQAYGKSATQVSLRWALEKGVALNTMSTKPNNIRANFEIMDFSLNSVDIEKIDALAARVNHRVVASVPWAPQWD